MSKIQGFSINFFELELWMSEASWNGLISFVALSIATLGQYITKIQRFSKTQFFKIDLSEAKVAPLISPWYVGFVLNSRP